MKRTIVFFIIAFLSLNAFTQLTIKEIQSKIDSLEILTQTIDSQLKVIKEEISDYQFDLKLERYKEGKLKMFVISSRRPLIEKFRPRPLPGISLAEKLHSYYPLFKKDNDYITIIGDESDKQFWRSKGYWVDSGLVRTKTTYYNTKKKD